MSTIDGRPNDVKGPSTDNPPTALDFLSADDHKRFERLLDRTLGHGFKLVMWETTVPRDRATVVAWLKAQLVARSARLIEIDLVKLLGVTDSGAPQSVNVWSALNQAVSPDSVADHQAILVVYGFEELMYHGTTDRSDLLQQMNVQRDILVRDYPCWWLLLIHPASRQQWRTVAPDFSDFVALWIEAPLATGETSTDRLVSADRTQDVPGSSRAGADEWPKQLLAADRAIRASQLDRASDLIYSFRAASDSNEQTERGLALADMLEGDIDILRGDSNTAFRRWRDQALPTFQRLGLKRDQSLIFERLGNLATVQGNLPEAQRLFSEALSIAQRLADSDPANAVWQRDLLVSFSKLGDLATLQGNLPEAQRLFGESLSIAQHLADSDSANAAWQRDLSVSLIKLGDLATVQGNLPEAQRLFGESLRITQRLADSTPANAEWQFDLGVANERLGNLAKSQGNLDEAHRFHTKRHTIIQRLADSNPANAAWQRDMSVSFSKLGDLATVQGNLPEAQRLFGESLSIAQRLADAAPANAARQRDLCVSFTMLGSLVRAQGNLSEAERLLNEALSIAQLLADSDPANVEWQRDLSVSLSKMGDLATAQGNLPEALRLFGQALRIAQRLADSDPANAEWQRDLSYSLTASGQLLMRQEHWNEALPMLEQSLAIDERLAAMAPTNAVIQNDVKVSRRLVAEVRAQAQNA